MVLSAQNKLDNANAAAEKFTELYMNCPDDHANKAFYMQQVEHAMRNASIYQAEITASLREQSPNPLYIAAEACAPAPSNASTFAISFFSIRAAFR